MARVSVVFPGLDTRLQLLYIYTMNDIDDILRYEEGQMTEDEVLELFQRLIDSGAAWSLQGHYGRTATSSH